jgi:hypothetical protein
VFNCAPYRDFASKAVSAKCGNTIRVEDEAGAKNRTGAQRLQDDDELGK